MNACVFSLFCEDASFSIGNEKKLRFGLLDEESVIKKRKKKERKSFKKKHPSPADTESDSNIGTVCRESTQQNLLQLPCWEGYRSCHHQPTHLLNEKTSLGDRIQFPLPPCPLRTLVMIGLHEGMPRVMSVFVTQHMETHFLHHRRHPRSQVCSLCHAALPIWPAGHQQTRSNHCGGSNKCAHRNRSLKVFCCNLVSVNYFTWRC